jgi:hypothetical protein
MAEALALPRRARALLLREVGKGVRVNATSHRTSASSIDDTLNRLARKAHRRSGTQRRYILLEEILDAQEKTATGVLDDLLLDERQPATVVVSLSDDPELTPIWTGNSREVEVVLDAEDVGDIEVEVDLAEEEEDDDENEVTLVRSFPPLAATPVVPDASHPAPPSVPAPTSAPPPVLSAPPPAPMPSMHDDRLAATFRVSRGRSRAGLGIALLSSFLFGVLSTLALTHAAYL